MPFLLQPSLKADMWSKHKSFLTGSTGVGDKLKTLETFAKCKDDDADGLQNLIGAIAALMQVAVPAHQKAKASKIIPASTTSYLQEMIAKATELRALVATKQKDLAGAAKNADASNKAPAKNAATNAPSNEWIKAVTTKINNYMSEVQEINNDVNSKKLTGAEINKFKEWMNNSQADIKKINEGIQSKTISNENAKIAETRINKYVEDLKKYDQGIEKMSKDAVTSNENAIQNDAKELAGLKSTFAKYEVDIIKNKNEITTLRSNFASRKGDRKSIELLDKDLLNYKNEVLKADNELKNSKISAEISKDIRAKILNYQTDIKNQEIEIKKIKTDFLKTAKPK